MVPMLQTPAENRIAPIGEGSGWWNNDLFFRMPHDATSLDGFRVWALSDDFPEHGRITFINGEVLFDMSGEEITAHAIVKTEVGRTLAQLCRDKSLGLALIDGCFVVNKKAKVANIPDVVFVSYDAIESGRVSLTPRKGRPSEKIELVGSPDVVVEIVSDSSVDKDVRRLRAAYHAADIREYWLIDARGDEIAFQILAHRRTGYASTPQRDGWLRSRVFDCEFRLVRVKDRVGIWDYRLEAKTK